MADTVERAPFPKDPEDFDADERVFFNKVSQNYTLEDEKGEEWDWLPTHSKWVPAVRFPQIPVEARDRLWPA